MTKEAKYGIKPKGRKYETEEGMRNNRRFLGRSERLLVIHKAKSNLRFASKKERRSGA
jgi:hypothetical protein